MRQIRATLESIFNGIGHYIIWYFWTAFLFYLGFHLLKIWDVSYWQSFGGVLLFRQMRGIIANPGNKHLPPEINREMAKQRISELVDATLIIGAQQGDESLSFEDARALTKEWTEQLVKRYIEQIVLFQAMGNPKIKKEEKK